MLRGRATVSNTKSPLRWIFDQARGLFRRMRGERIDKVVEATPILRDRFLAVEQGTGWLANLNGSLQSGDISIQRWVLDFRQRLKKTYIDQYVLARGGRANMAPQDWGKLGAMLKKQYGFLNGFADDVAAGKLSEGRIQARAELYFKSARQAYERGKEAQLGMPPLPAHPGDGSTVCLSNCQCHWDIRETDDEWLATWTLGAAEHCPDCVQRAGEWAPLRMPKL